MRSVKDFIPSLLEPLQMQKGFIVAQIFTHWETIVGPELASLAKPFGIQSKKRGGGVLTLETSSGKTVFMAAMEEDVINKINTYFEDMMISKVQFKHTLVTLKKRPVKAFVISPEDLDTIQDRMTMIENRDLKNVLERIGIAILEKKNGQ